MCVTVSLVDSALWKLPGLSRPTGGSPLCLEFSSFGAVRAGGAARGAALPAVVLTGASFVAILFFHPIFGLKHLSGLAFHPVVQMFSSLHSFENNGLFAGHGLSLFKRNNPYP